MYIILALLLLAILITVHEFGHFLAARAMKIEVREFAIGMGPKIIGWKSKKYETDFSIRAVPLGGFCAFYGEDDTTGESKDDPRAFPKQNVWKRMFVILMGPMMNLVLAFVVATCFFWANGVEVQTGVDPYIVEVAAAGPAHSAGLQADDIITEINGVNMLDGTQTTLFNTIGNWKEGDSPLKMTVRRGEETFETEMTPFWDEEEGKISVTDYSMEPVGYATIQLIQTGIVTKEYSGADYIVTASYGPEENFPANTEMKVREIRPDTPEYALYSGLTEEALAEENT